MWEPAICRLGATGVGLFVDHLEVAAQLGDESLTGRRPGTAPKAASSKHIAQDGLMLGRRCRSKPLDAERELAAIVIGVSSP